MNCYRIYVFHFIIIKIIILVVFLPNRMIHYKSLIQHLVVIVHFALVKTSSSFPACLFKVILFILVRL